MLRDVDDPLNDDDSLVGDAVEEEELFKETATTETKFTKVPMVWFPPQSDKKEKTETTFTKVPMAWLPPELGRSANPVTGCSSLVKS